MKWIAPNPRSGKHLYFPSLFGLGLIYSEPVKNLIKEQYSEMFPEQSGYKITRKGTSQIAEYAFLIMIGATFISGLIGDIFVFNGKVLLNIKNIESFSINMLQIQAGISTLTVALIALITGLIGVEHYGVSITRYFLVLKPRVLKLFVVIGSSASLVFIGILFHLFHLFNIVMACFFCEWWLILASLCIISGLFQGSHYNQVEIKDAGALLEKEIEQKLRQRLEKEIPVEILADEHNVLGLELKKSRMPVFEVQYRTEDLDLYNISQDFDLMIGALYDGVCDTLQEDNHLEDYYCRQMPDANHYMEMIRRNEINAFLGNQFSLYPLGPENRKLFLDYMNHHVCMFSISSRSGIGFYLDSLKLRINDVRVIIEEPDQRIFETEIINESGSVMVDLGNGNMGVFTQKAAEEYLKNKYKLLLIYITVSVYAKDGLIGFIAV